ncbi:MAG: SDR family oxidoreductase [Myxococcota bacterium]|jgi:NAD(P)-dependent dehydrogenase (short-subunit alcohol dehydrogenase family)
MASLASKTAVITGATSGIGRATALELARRGARLLLVGRNEQRSRETLEAIRAAAPKCDVELIRGDFATQAEVRRVGEELAKRIDSLDLLINNHGVTMMRRELTPDGFETTLAINHLGYFHLTGVLLPKLQRTPGARIVSVASEAHRFGALDLDDLHSEKFSAMRVYGKSKSANIHFTRELARRYGSPQLTINCVHPGGVATNLGAGQGPWLDRLHKLVMLFMKTPEQGAQTSIYAATSAEAAGKNGAYYSDCKPKEPAAHCRDQATARALWDVSEKLTGFAYPSP